MLRWEFYSDSRHRLLFLSLGLTPDIATLQIGFPGAIDISQERLQFRHMHGLRSIYQCCLWLGMKIHQYHIGTGGDALSGGVHQFQ